MLTVLVYDVVSDTRRARLHALLKQYGQPIQKSAFEARLTAREREQLLRRVERLLDAREDRFVLYGITHDQEERIAVIGVPRPVLTDATFFLV
jgi:CRISPR-associated endonuclease Cas2